MRLYKCFFLIKVEVSEASLFYTLYSIFFVVG